ncbi:MAG: TRAP transporter small permease [Eubacteriales bacterium]
MKKIEKFFYFFNEVMVFLAKLMLVVMTLVTCSQVFTRKFFNYSIRWSEELPLILMIWFGFIAMAIGVREYLHISIEVIYKLFPKKMQKIVEKFAYLMVAAFGIFMVIWGWELTSKMMTSTLPATKMPRGYLYIVMPFSGALIAYYSIMDVLGVKRYEGKKRADENEVMNNGL